MTAPLVSVIMASYNAASFVGEAIDSVLGQSYEALELIVVDDCSSDGTAEIVAGYAKRHPDRLRWKPKRVREGPCRARNERWRRRGGRSCAGSTTMTRGCRPRSKRRFAYSRRGRTWGSSTPISTRSIRAPAWPDGWRDVEGDVLADLLLIGCFIGSITTMFRRSAIDRRGGRLRERDFSIGDDYYLWLTIALDWKVARVPRVLARYRRHARNESMRAESQVDIGSWRARLTQEFLDEFPEAMRRLRRRERCAGGAAAATRAPRVGSG